MAVTQASSPGMSVLVAPGTALIPTGTYPTSYNFHVAIDTSGGESLTIATAPTSNSRIDAVVAYADLSVTPSSSPANNPGILKLYDVQGTVAASPSAPSSAQIQSAIGAANPYIVLAYVTVGTNVTQIVNSNVSDQRSFASLSTGNLTNAYSFRVWRNASWNQANAANAMTFDTASGTQAWNIGSAYSTSTGKFTALIPGKYHFDTSVGFAVNADGVAYYSSFFVNGIEVSRGPQLQTGVGSGQVASHNSDTLLLNVGDYVQVYSFWGGSTVGGLYGNAYDTWFSGYLESR